MESQTPPIQPQKYKTIYDVSSFAITLFFSYLYLLPRKVDLFSNPSKFPCFAFQIT